MQAQFRLVRIRQVITVLLLVGVFCSAFRPGDLNSVRAQSETGIFVDPLYGYSLSVPEGWNVTAPNVDVVAQSQMFNGVTLLENYDSFVAETQGKKPEDLKIQIGVGPLSSPDLFEWVQNRIWNETSSPDFLDFHYQATSPQAISLGNLHGYQFTMTGQDPASSVTEIDLLAKDDLIVSIGLSPSDSPNLSDALRILSTLDFSTTQLNAQDFSDNPKPKVPIPDLLESKPTYTTSSTHELQPSVIHPPGWGSEAPNSPITLYMPFHDGETWEVGGVGYFYGDGDHTNSWNDYYATDWNRPAGDDLGKDVLPIAGGNVIQRQIAPCPTTGYGCFIKIDHGSGITSLYGHLSAVSRDLGGVNHWDVIGQVGSSGNSTGAHLHLQFRQNGSSTCRNNGSTCPNGESPAAQQSPKPSPMNTQQGSVMLNDSYTYTSNNKEDSPQGCPVLSGEVRLYDSPNCGGSSTTANGTGLWSMASSFNDKAESIAIPSGWSARLYQNDNENLNESACFSSTDTNLNDNTFANGGTVGNQATWMRVYNNGNCSGGTAPSAPSLSSPGNGSSNPSSYDLTFQWNSSSGATEYLVEWWGGPYNTMQPCGWNSSTSCHIGTVTPGNTYSWHVKARNSVGESNWSDTWTFTVQSNAVPDLVIQSITASPSSPSTNQSVTFTVRVKNQGTGNVSSSFYVDLYIDQQPVTNCSDTGTNWWSVNSLAAGATQDLTYTYGGFSTGGAHNLYAFADTNCDVSESNDNNNVLGPVTLNVQQIQAPPAPTLSSPGNGSANPSTYDLTFQWNASSGATEYLVEWWGGPYSTMQPCGWNSATSCHIGQITAGNTYSWHVKARNSAGESNWSSTWTFSLQGNTAPDLVIQSITASPSAPSVNQSVTFTIRVKNQGSGSAAASFYVDFYIDQQPVTDCTDTGTAWWSVGSLAAGATQDLTYTYAGFSNSGTHHLYAFADTNCDVAESNDNNNVAGPVDLTVQTGTGSDADTTGVFRPTNGALYLKNSNTSGYADIGINYGMGGDYPVTGDWDGNGTDTIGVYRNGVFYLRNSNTIGIADVYFAFGSPGDQPIAGDWDGDGKDTVGVYRPSTGTFYLRYTNSAGAPDRTFQLGMPGDVGIAGDWNGDGIDTTGVFRPSNGYIFLKNQNSTGYADVGLNYGIPGDKPVTGDWNNDGIDTIGVYRAGKFYLRNSNTPGYADLVFALGISTDMPIAGNWDGVP